MSSGTFDDDNVSGLTLPADEVAKRKMAAQAEAQARFMRLDLAKRNLAECLNATVGAAMHGAISGAVVDGKLDVALLERNYANLQINIGLAVEVAVQSADRLLVRLGFIDPTPEQIAETAAAVARDDAARAENTTVVDRDIAPAT